MEQTTGRASVLAALAVLAGMAVFGLVDNLIPLITGDIGLWQFHALRSAVAMPVLAGVAVLMRRRNAVHSAGAVVARSLLTGTALVIYFGCLGFLPIGAVAAGLFTAPVFVILIGVAMGRPIGIWRLGAVILGFGGILMVLQPGGAGFGPLSLVPVVAGALYGAGAVVTRECCARESTLILLAGFFVVLGLWGVVGLAAMPADGAGWVLRGWAGMPAPHVWAVIGVQSIGSLAAMGMVIWGYQTGDAALAGVCEYALLIFAAFWAWILRGEVLNPLAMTGIACIVLAGALITLRPGARPT